MKYRAELFLRIGGLVLLAVFSYKIARPEIFLKLPRAAAPRSVLAGELDIPRLNMSVAIVEGDDERASLWALDMCPALPRSEESEIP